MFNTGYILVRPTRFSPPVKLPIDEYFRMFDNGENNDDEDYDAYFRQSVGESKKIKEKHNNNNMKLQEKDLKSLIEATVAKFYEECVEEGCTTELDESTFEIDADDSNMQTKISKIKNDSTLFNKDTDEIKITSETKTYNEFANMVNEARKEKSKNDDYLKAIKKADRELDIELNGPGFKAGSKPHKDKTKYDRKSKYTKSDLIEMFTKNK